MKRHEVCLPHHFHRGAPDWSQVGSAGGSELPERKRLEAVLPRSFPAPRPLAEGLACLLHPQGCGRGAGRPAVWQEAHFPGLLTGLSLFLKLT